MRTNYKHITAADQRLIKQMAAQAISPLPKRMSNSEKEAILTYFPARFKDYRVTNIVAHIRMWQSFPADTFAQHQARMTAKHTSSHFGLFKPEKEEAPAAPAEVVDARATRATIASPEQDGQQKRGASSLRSSLCTLFYWSINKALTEHPDEKVSLNNVIKYCERAWEDLEEDGKIVF